MRNPSKEPLLHNLRKRKLLEALVFIILMLLLIPVATLRIWELRAAAERTAVEMMLGNLRSYLGMHAAKVALAQGLDGVAALDGMDPSDVVATPTNYHTVEALPPVDQMAPYTWYFDRSSRVLVYRPGNEEYVESALPGPVRLRFRITLQYEDQNRNGRFDRRESLHGIALVPLEPYRWRTGVK